MTSVGAGIATLRVCVCADLGFVVPVCHLLAMRSGGEEQKLEAGRSWWRS